MALTTDATPRIHLTPAQVLGDPQRVARLKVALVEGALSRTPDEGSATRVVDECVKICFLQTPLLAEHTPFYWVIVHRDPIISGVPPLIFSAACWAEYDSDLYCAIQPYISRIPGHRAYSDSTVITGVEDRPRITASVYQAVGAWKTTINFRIPRFYSRLFADEEVWFEVPVTTIGRIWRMKARRIHEKSDALNGYPHWIFEVEEIWHGEPAHWRINLLVKDPEGDAHPLVVCSERDTYLLVNRVPTAIPISNHYSVPHLAMLRRNPYTSNPSGQLWGELTLQLA
ncbi:hypothetical protein FA13DRAFT_1735645 [Coprinellus micaceus]|uniref:Uncharacterized protein n=1 Tax=Coprinellus micaceus TaxID=71717 RepID=A0A4Y7T2X4_COPMI|nr:hypothetical protein FA13DRAFT_1735645 [Coprinellus micaceus]